MNKEEDVVAIFTKETARWDPQSNTYVDRKISAEVRDIKMAIEGEGENTILRFIGGPTGFEAYYVKDLAGWQDRSGSFCICAGTVNSWPMCEVHWADVQEFLMANGL